MQDRLHAVPTLIFIDIDNAVTLHFLAFLRQLYNISRIDRLILDEAYLVLTTSDYHENLGLLRILRQIIYPFIYLTTTLLPYKELDLT